jgi:hypothetical protein
MDLFIDCGAPTLYNSLVRKKTSKGVKYMGSTIAARKHDDHSYIKTPMYKKYMKDYRDFLLKNKEHINIYTNLDVINNSEETWKNQQWFESFGLNPVPIWHFGEDVKWLEMYLEKGYDYIAMGGIVPNPYKEVVGPLDKIWHDLLTDNRGYPTVKIHGFAITAPRLLFRYPWFSVDSTSWVRYGMYGMVIIPRIKNGKRDYRKSPMSLFVNKRAQAMHTKGRHITTLSKIEKVKVLEYFEEKGFILGDSAFRTESKGYLLKENESIAGRSKDSVLVEEVLVPGISNNGIMRDTLNAMYYVDMNNTVPEWPWPIKKKIKGFL